MDEYLNTIFEIKKTISQLESQIKHLEEKILSIKKEEFLNIVVNEKLLNEFTCFLKNNKQLKQGTINDYCSELRKIRIEINSIYDENIPCEIYEINDLKSLYKIQELFYNSKEILSINKKNHNSLSAALNNYVMFIEYKKTDVIVED